MISIGLDGGSASPANLNTVKTALTNTDVSILGTTISYERHSPFFPPFFPPYFAPPPPPPVDPCAGCPARDTFVGLNCDGQYLQGVYTDGCCGEYVKDRVLTDGWCGYVNCATHACPTVAPTWNFVFPYDGGNGWINGTYNDQPCLPHCANDGYLDYNPNYCTDGLNSLSRWIAYNDGTSCCAFNLYLFCY